MYLIKDIFVVCCVFNYFLLKEDQNANYFRIIKCRAIFFLILALIASNFSNSDLYSTCALSAIASPQPIKDCD